VETHTLEVVPQYSASRQTSRNITGVHSSTNLTSEIQSPISARNDCKRVRPVVKEINRGEYIKSMNSV